jgi:hypothetical protein
VIAGSVAFETGSGFHLDASELLRFIRVKHCGCSAIIPRHYADTACVPHQPPPHKNEDHLSPNKAEGPVAWDHRIPSSLLVPPRTNRALFSDHPPKSFHKNEVRCCSFLGRGLVSCGPRTVSLFWFSCHRREGSNACRFRPNPSITLKKGPNPPLGRSVTGGPGTTTPPVYATWLEWNAALLGGPRQVAIMPCAC